MTFTSSQIEEAFRLFNNEQQAGELNRSARELLPLAEASEAFKAMAGVFIQKFGESFTVAGFKHKSIHMIILATFLLGYRYRDQQGAGDPPIDEALMQRMLKQIEGAKE